MRTEASIHDQFVILFSDQCFLAFENNRVGWQLTLQNTGNQNDLLLQDADSTYM